MGFSWFLQALTDTPDVVSNVEPSVREIQDSASRATAPEPVTHQAVLPTAIRPFDPPTNVNRPLHWQPTGQFPLYGVGTSNYEPAIAAIAQNPKGKNALVFCTASLVPENTNAYDLNAVMVVIDGQTVGYLPREYAKVFRSYFEKFGLPIQVTTCDAVISNGLKTEDRQYGYSIELDINLEPSALTQGYPTYPCLDKRDSTPSLRKQYDGRYLIEVRLEQGVREDMRECVDSWTTDHWDEINYYFPNSKNIGLGHKLFGVPKTLHGQLFGEYEPEVLIESLVGRTAVIAMKPAVLPSNADVQERTEKYAFVFTNRVTPIKAQDQWWDEARYMQHVRDGKAGNRYKWFIPFLPDDMAGMESLLMKATWGPQSLHYLLKEIRALIRACRKSIQPHDVLLRALYGICLAVDFVAALTFEATSAQELALHVDVQELKKVQIDYGTMGYRDSKTLSEMDVKWLVKAFGEPQVHQTFDAIWQPIRNNAISRYCWAKVGETLCGEVTAAQHEVMKAWLDHKVTVDLL